MVANFSVFLNIASVQTLCKENGNFERQGLEKKCGENRYDVTVLHETHSPMLNVQ